MTEDKGNNYVEIKHSTEKESSLPYIIFFIIVAITSHLVRPWNEHPEMAITIIILAVILIPIVIMRVMALELLASNIQKLTFLKKNLLPSFDTR